MEMNKGKLSAHISGETNKTLEGYKKQYKADPTMLSRIKVLQDHIITTIQLAVYSYEE